MTATNLTKPKGQRTYFSAPDKEEGSKELGFSPPPRRSPASSGPRTRQRRTEKPQWSGDGAITTGGRPEWNANVHIFSDINSDLPACRRLYFSETADRPVREALRSKVVKSLSTKSLQAAASPTYCAGISTPMERF